MGTGQKRPQHPIILKLCVACGVLLPLASVYPGLVLDLAMFTVIFSPLWFPLLAICGLIRWIRSARAAKACGPPPAIDQAPGDLHAGPAWRRSPWTGIIVLAVWILLMGACVPRRLAFLASRPEFDRHVASAPISSNGGRPLDRRLGLYHIDEYAADPRGGVYFRSRWSWDGMGPDRTSYGFAFRPNPEGTPFGRSGYSLFHLAGDWYSFAASDDLH